GAARKLRRRQRVVRAALVLLGLGGPSLRNRHVGFYPFFSLRAKRKERRIRGGLLMQLHIAKNRHPRIGMGVVAAAFGFVQIDAAARAEPAALLVAERTRGQRQQRLLPNQRLEVELFAAVEAETQLAGVKLLVLGRRRIGRQHEIEFLLERERVALQ